MRIIQVEKWTDTVPDGSSVENSVLKIISFLISQKKPEELPKGIEKFRIFVRLAKAFDSAEIDGVLRLEEQDFLFLKGLVEKDIPSIWGTDKFLSKAIENFLDAMEE